MGGGTGESRSYNDDGNRNYSAGVVAALGTAAEATSCPALSFDISR